MPDLQRLSEEMDGKAVVLGVNQGQDSPRSPVLQSSVGVDYPLLLDEDSVTNRLYRVVALPTTYFIDGDGVIFAKSVGRHSNASCAPGQSRKFDRVTANGTRKIPQPGLVALSAATPYS